MKMAWESRLDGRSGEQSNHINDYRRIPIYG